MVKVKLADNHYPGTFSLSQLGVRMLPRNCGYEYSGSHIMVLKLNNGVNLDDGVTYFGGHYGLNRDTHVPMKDVEPDWENQPGEMYIGDDATLLIFGFVEWNGSV